MFESPKIVEVEFVADISIEAGVYASRDGTNNVEFMQQYSDVVHLCLPAPLKRILELGGDESLSTESEAIAEVWSYSELGRALFSSSISGIASEQMRKKIDEK
eukprot:4451666-Amphidinium_carterae.5